jgi:hypothetical protein
VRDESAVELGEREIEGGFRRCVELRLTSQRREISTDPILPELGPEEVEHGLP